MPITELTALAEDLERHLGDPADPDSPMPFARILELDEREEYPHEFIALVQRWGLHEFFVPEANGGRAVDVQDGWHLVRLLARRDPTTATTMMLTSLSFMPIWVAGTPEQRQYFSDALRNGAKLAWGLSERDHGSDILANETLAEPVAGGYRLTGEKWLIGNATVADVVMVFARTRPQGGPGGYSIFAVEKCRLPAGAVVPLPNEPLLGLRGLDVSGVRLDGCVVPASARIGEEGQGLEIALKASQLARATISSLALGCADTALRLTIDFASRREIFGQRVSEIPYSRRQLAECFADVMIADAVGATAVRSLQVVPAQASVWSSIAKFLVPTLLEATMSQLAIVLGARHYLRARPDHGVFPKLLCDIRVATFADGNTVVNLKNIAAQLLGLLSGATEAAEEARAEAALRARTLFDVSTELPPYRPWEQALFSRGADDALLALPHAIDALRVQAASASDVEEAAWLARAVTAAERLLDDIANLRVEHDALRLEFGREASQSAELFDLAKRYCGLNAAAVCVQMYVHGRDAAEDPLPSAALLLLCLERLGRWLRPLERLTGPAEIDAVATVLQRLHAGGRLFAHLPVQISTISIPTTSEAP